MYYMMSDHHRMLIALHLEHIDLLDEQIERLSAEIAARLRPYVNSIGGFSIFLAGEAAGFRPSTQGGKRRLHA